MPSGGSRIGVGRPQTAGATTPALKPTAAARKAIEARARAAAKAADEEKPATDSTFKEGGGAGDLGPVIEDETPLAYMLRVMRDGTAPNWRRDVMAARAAPFVHPRSIEHTGPGGGALQVIVRSFVLHGGLADAEQRINSPSIRLAAEAEADAGMGSDGGRLHEGRSRVAAPIR